MKNIAFLLTVLGSGDAIASRSEVVTVAPPATPEYVKASCGNQGSPECRAAKELLARQVAEDLKIIGESHERKYRPAVISASSLPYPSIRSAAACALGAMQPDASDTPVLRELVNDPVPSVRHCAMRSLQGSRDPAAQVIVHRGAERASTTLDEKASTTPDSPPDAKQLGAPVPDGSTFLFFASNLRQGQAAFTTPESSAAVIQKLTAQSSQPAMTANQLAQALGAKPSSSGEVSAAQEKALAYQEIAKRYQDAINSGKSMMEAASEMRRDMERLEAGKKAPAPEAKAQRYAGSIDQREFQKLTHPYEQPTLFGSPQFIILDGGKPAGHPDRFAVVFEDKALGKTGVVFHFPVP